MKDRLLARVFLVVLGSAVMGFSIDLLVAAGFGLDPLSLFQAGLCNVFHISLGQASQALMFGIIVVLFFLDRKRIGIGSILNSLLVGAFVTLFAPYVSGGGGSDLWLRIVWVAGGFLLMGIGIGLYISAQLGEAGIDAMMMYFSDMFKLPLGKTRVVLDILLAATGFLLGGSLGWATLVSMMLNGFIIQATVSVMKRVLNNQ